jgi:hypothetical protein
MIGGKMVGTVLALMIADIKRISQLFGLFKTTDRFNCRYIAETSKIKLKEGRAIADPALLSIA